MTSKDIKNTVIFVAILGVLMVALQFIPMVRELKWEIHGWQGWTLFAGFLVAYTVAGSYVSSFMVGLIGVETLSHPVSFVAFRTALGLTCGFVLGWFCGFFPSFLLVSSVPALAILLGAISCGSAVHRVLTRD